MAWVPRVGIEPGTTVNFQYEAMPLPGERTILTHARKWRKLWTHLQRKVSIDHT